MRRASSYLPLAIFFAVWLCLLQALYYPFLSEPSIAEWWQVGPMAGFGYIVGFPVFWFWGSLFNSGPLSAPAFWLLSATYVGMLYLGLRFVWSRIKS